MVSEPAACCAVLGDVHGLAVVVLSIVPNYVVTMQIPLGVLGTGA